MCSRRPNQSISVTGNDDIWMFVNGEVRAPSILAALANGVPDMQVHRAHGCCTDADRRGVRAHTTRTVVGGTSLAVSPEPDSLLKLCVQPCAITSRPLSRHCTGTITSHARNGA